MSTPLPGTSTEGLLAVITTVATRDDALRLAHALVGQRLVACAQLSAIESVYVWAGAVQQEPEYRLLFKTTTARYPALVAALQTLHPYELPAIVAVPLEASAAFADWVRAGTQA